MTIESILPAVTKNPRRGAPSIEIDLSSFQSGCAIIPTVYPCDCKPAGEPEAGVGYVKQLLGVCKYFSVTLYTVEDMAEISLDDTSFSAIVFLDGMVRIKTDKQKSNFKAGDSYFVPAGKKVLEIVGKCQFVLSRI